MKALSACCLLVLATTSAPLSGDEILARAGAAQGLSTYSVPVHFEVHMRRPIGVRSAADAIIYYRTPAQAVLTITKIPGIIGRFFKGTYATELVPQVWPSQYSVNSMSPAQLAGASTFVLHAVPKLDPSVDHVDFTVAQADDAPLAVAWYYKNGSTIRLSMVCQTTANYSLVKSETIAVSMPQFALDATGVYGAYALNAPVPDSAFAGHASSTPPRRRSTARAPR
jgi:hypothetical protein